MNRTRAAPAPVKRQPNDVFENSSLSLPSEPERYELNSSPPYHFDLDRRAFFKVAGCGVAVFVVLRDALGVQESGGHRRHFEQPLPQEIGAWLHVGEDGSVTVYT